MSMRRQHVLMTANMIPRGQNSYRFMVTMKDLTDQMFVPVQTDSAALGTTGDLEDLLPRQYGSMLGGWLGGVFRRQTSQSAFSQQ